MNDTETLEAVAAKLEGKVSECQSQIEELTMWDNDSKDCLATIRDEFCDLLDFIKQARAA